MFTFNYHRAESVKDVCNQLNKYKNKAQIVAGGTDIMVQIRDKDERWAGLDCIIDITALKELRTIKEDGDLICIGALCTHTDIEYSPLIKEHLPFLSTACGTVGSPQIRNLGTIGGSICNGSPAADPLTPLIATNARVRIAGVDGTREISLKDLYKGKSEMDLATGEFVTEFIVEKLPSGATTAFSKLGRRKALAISRLNAAVTMTKDDAGKIASVTISPGCIFTQPDRVETAEAILIGKQPSEELFEKAGKAVSDEMIKRTGIRWSTEYKQPAIEGVVVDALMDAAGLGEV